MFLARAIDVCFVLFCVSMHAPCEGNANIINSRDVKEEKKQVPLVHMFFSSYIYFHSPCGNLSFGCCCISWSVNAAKLSAHVQYMYTNSHSTHTEPNSLGAFMKSVGSALIASARTLTVLCVCVCVSFSLSLVSGACNFCFCIFDSVVFPHLFVVLVCNFFYTCLYTHTDQYRLSIILNIVIAYSFCISLNLCSSTGSFCTFAFTDLRTICQFQRPLTVLTLAVCTMHIYYAARFVFPPLFIKS